MSRLTRGSTWRRSSSTECCLERKPPGTTFSLGHRPSCLRRIPATSIDDYNSVDHLREASMFARRARLWGYKLFGYPDTIQPEPERDNIKPVVEPTAEQRSNMPQSS